MTTTAAHMAARNDRDLIERFIAKAEMLEMPDPMGWVQQNLSKLITQEVQDDQTITDVHAYADGYRTAYIAATPPPPGQNLGAVTDAHLEAAITAVFSPPAVD